LAGTAETPALARPAAVVAAAAPAVAAALRAKRAALILRFMIVSFLSVRV
jgi:hypothetical protein